MSTKKIGRSIVEGGHPASVQFNIRRMKRSERLQARKLCRRPDLWDEECSFAAKKETGKKYFCCDIHGHKSFHLIDKFFLSYVGRPISEAVSNLCHAHRSQSFQDRLLTKYLLETVEYAYRAHLTKFLIDENGIICKND